MPLTPSILSYLLIFPVGFNENHFICDSNVNKLNMRCKRRINVRGINIGGGM